MIIECLIKQYLPHRLGPYRLKYDDLPVKFIEISNFFFLALFANDISDPIQERAANVMYFCLIQISYFVTSELEST